MSKTRRKNLSFVVEIGHPNARVHRVLFAENTPFKPKVVQDKTLYRRRSKHQKGWDSVA